LPHVLALKHYRLVRFYSRRALAAATRAAAGLASWLMIPARTLTQRSVCPRASERRSAAILFRGMYF
jgi:hypothetical protein